MRVFGKAAAVMTAIALTCTACRYAGEREIQSTETSEEMVVQDSEERTEGEMVVCEETQQKDDEASWQKEAWDKFSDYTPAEWVSSGEYTGFLDCLYYDGEMPWARIGQVYPSGDYDGDGEIDRLYGRYIRNQQCDIYLFLSSGDIILLNEDEYLNPLNTYELEGYDWTGDGQPEINCWITVDGGTGVSSYNFSVFEKTENGWEAMTLPGKDLRIKVREVDETHMRVTQPDYGISAVYEVYVGMIDEYRYGQPDNVTVMEAGLLERESVLWTDPNTDERVIRTEWDMIPSKWYYRCAAVGNWVYEEGEWQLRDILVGGFDTWGDFLYLDVEKTEAEMSSGKTLLDVIGWLPKSDSENAAEQTLLQIRSNGEIYSSNLINGSSLGGYCEIKGVTDLTKDRVQVCHLSVSGEPVEEGMVLYQSAEGDRSWLVMEYKGEKLYWEDRWGSALSVEVLESDAPTGVGGSYPYYIEELNITLDIPENFCVYRTSAVLTDWEGDRSAMDCAQWILITDKEYSEEYLLGEMAVNIEEELEHIVYCIELIPRELYPVRSLCFAVFEQSEMFETDDGYCRYYDSGYSIRREDKAGRESLWCPGADWTAALEGELSHLVRGWYGSTVILEPTVSAGTDRDGLYWYTMVNDVWWQGYCEAVRALESELEVYSCDETVKNGIIEQVWESYEEYLVKYGEEDDPKLLKVYMDQTEDIYLRAHEYARVTAFYELRGNVKTAEIEDLKNYLVVYLEWDNGQRSFAMYQPASALYRMDYPDAEYQKIGGNYDYMVDLQPSYDYMQKHMSEKPSTD